MPGDEGCRTAVFGKTERTVGGEGNGDPVRIELLRHCTRGNPQQTDRPSLPPLTHSFTLDFVITGASRERLENEVQPWGVPFLKERGLEWSEEKTRIVPIEQGFDFLGFNVRKYRGKRLIKPAKPSIVAVKEKVRDILRQGASLSQRELIHRLNPVIRGGANDYRHGVSQEVFSEVDPAIGRMTGNWAKRRHPHRARQWGKNRYFTHMKGRDWVFTDGSVTLFWMSSIPIQRHVRIRGDANPYDSAQAGDFAARQARPGTAVSALPPTWLVL
jgi:RNA-directed DNA polymerase